MADRRDVQLWQRSPFSRRLHLHCQELATWVYRRRWPHCPPLFQSDGDDMVSFLQMIEIMVAGRFRKSSRQKKAIPIWKVRRAYDLAREKFQLQYPFAHLQLESIGGFIVHMLAREEVPGSFQALDTPEQWTLPGVVKNEIDHLEYMGAWASRWFPLGKEMPIVIDPKISAGRPVLRGRGVPVQIVWSQRRLASMLNLSRRIFKSLR